MLAHDRDQRVHLLDGRPGGWAPACRHSRCGSTDTEVPKPMAPASIASRISFFIARDLVGGGRALGRFLAHDVQAQRRVAEQGRDIDRRAALLQRVEILREGLERPVMPRPASQRVEAHALDLLERLHDQLAMDRLGRRDAEAAIADHRRGDAMPGRDAEHAVPQDLGVVVRVHVDEARRDDLAGGVDGRVGRPVGLAQGHHLAVLDAEVAREAGLARAVDDRAARDLEVVGHGWPLGLLQNTRPVYVVRRRRRKHMAKHKIALIPGDGIGKEVLPEGVRVLEAAARRFSFQLEFTDFDWSCDRLCQDRQDDAGRRHGAAQGVREHLPRRGRLAGRARPRLAVGPADPDPPRLPRST